METLTCSDCWYHDGDKWCFEHDCPRKKGEIACTKYKPVDHPKK